MSNKQLFVVRYGEIALKGHNQADFVKRLVKNMKLALRAFADISITREHGRIFLYCWRADRDAVGQVLGRVFGIVSYSPADSCTLDIDVISQLAIKQMQRCVAARGSLSFKVETRRVNKAFPYTSPDLSREVGARILASVDGLTVDVHTPDVVCQIELRGQAYLYTAIVPAVGGMPYKSAGRGLLLLSGGIDSPVAGYLMARRGLEIEALHFHSFPFTSQRALDKVRTLARKLAGYTQHIQLTSVNISDIQLAIREHCPSDEMTILSRRAMMKIAARLAEERQCQALITGESLGQVASQTVQGIHVTNSAVDIPVFRPLVAYDKLDIIDIAQRIDCYDTSILPFEDCCTVFLPKRVVTKPRLANILKSEALYPLDALVDNALANRKTEAVDIDEHLEL